MSDDVEEGVGVELLGAHGPGTGVRHGSPASQAPTTPGKTPGRTPSRRPVRAAYTPVTPAGEASVDGSGGEWDQEAEAEVQVQVQVQVQATARDPTPATTGTSNHQTPVAATEAPGTSRRVRGLAYMAISAVLFSVMSLIGSLYVAGEGGKRERAGTREGLWGGGGLARLGVA